MSKSEYTFWDVKSSKHAGMKKSIEPTEMKNSNQFIHQTDLLTRSIDLHTMSISDFASLNTIEGARNRIVLQCGWTRAKAVRWTRV